MAACSSGVARPAVSSITETRYCISDHLLWFGVPLVGGRSSSASAMSRASAGCIPLAPSEPIGLDGYAPRSAPRADQLAVTVNLMSCFPSPVVWDALVGCLSPLLRTPLPRSDTACRISSSGCATATPGNERWNCGGPLLGGRSSHDQ